MDALRRAEEAKRLAEPSVRPAAAAAAPELSLDPLETPPAMPQHPLPPLSRHLDSIDADLAAAATMPPPSMRAPTPEEKAAATGNREAAERAAARNVFTAKQASRSRTSLWLFLGFVGVATLAIVGYFGWQLQSIGPSALTRPATALPASPVRAVNPALGAAPLPLAATPLESSPPRPLPRTPASASRAERPQEAPASVPETEAVFRLSTNRTVQDQTLEHAYEALQADRLDDAHSGYERVLRRDPRNADALLGLAVIASRRDQINRAQHLYLQVLEANPGDVTAQAALIDLRGQTDAGQSESRLKILLANQPDSPGLHFALGNLYARQSRWSEAQQAYFQAYALEPDNADYLFNIAVSLDHLRQSRLAAQYYRMALSTAETRRSTFDQKATGERLLELQQ